jgi:CheY-like chemotaxis protein
MVKIVIIDDNKVITGVYTHKLRQAGFEVDVANDGRAGLALISRTKPDLVLLDLALPGLSGVEILRRLRAGEEFRDLPVIVFSGSYSGDVVESAWEAGATRVLAKGSVTPNQITETIREVLNMPTGPLPPPTGPPPPPTGPLPPPTGALRSPTGALSADPSRTTRPEDARGPGPETPKRVLVLEDDPIITAVVKGILEQEGFTMVSTVDGREAYKLLERDANFVAGIFDVMVPFIHGLEILRYMRTEKRLMSIPVILTSGHANQRLDLEKFSGAAVKFLPKPFTRAQLQAVLREMLSGGGER